MANVHEMELKINMSAQMTNDELREAIKYAHDMANNHVATHPLFVTVHGHLIQLLEIQRSRAAACSADNSNNALSVKKETL